MEKLSDAVCSVLEWIIRIMFFPWTLLIKLFVWVYKDN